MVKARKYVAKKRFQGMPKKSDIELVEYELPFLKNGDVLIKAEWISVDPAQRLLNIVLPIPYDIHSYQVGLVIDSKDPAFPVGTRIVTNQGWCDYTIINQSEKTGELMELSYKLPDLSGLSNSLGLGAVGMPGATAYFGLLEVCKPKEGETIAVSGAAGAVGTIVGQIAKIKGCKVIGFAGSDEKCEWLEKDLGFDKAINYKIADIDKSITEAAPNGFDCYFDNVGGELSSTILKHMKNCGRVAVCGSVSSYNDQNVKASVVQTPIVLKQLKLEGFHGNKFEKQWPLAFKQITDWILSGKVKAGEHVTEGFENIYEAFVGMLSGDNFGKAVVKV